MADILRIRKRERKQRENREWNTWTEGDTARENDARNPDSDWGRPGALPYLVFAVESNLCIFTGEKYRSLLPLEQAVRVKKADEWNDRRQVS